MVVAPGFCNWLIVGVGEGPRARAVGRSFRSAREGEDMTMPFEEEEIAVMHRANMMDQDREPWQGFMIRLRKLGSQADLKIAALHGCFALHNEFVSELAAAFDCWHYLRHLGYVRSRLPGTFRASSHSFSEITVHIAYQLYCSYASLHTRMEIVNGAVVTASVRESEQGVRAPVYRILPTISKTQWPLVPP